MATKKSNMEPIVMCIYGEGETCEKDCPMFKKCWGKK